MAGYVLRFDQIDRTQIAVAGGKGANLGELSRIDGIRVPAGFCITTDAFRRIMADVPSIEVRIDRLSRVRPGDCDAIRALAADVRQTIETLAIPHDLAASITDALAWLGEHVPCAVRSSATAEDLPTTSFAGQHDSYLNVAGSTAILRHVSRCWGSLFTERAVTYRVRHGIDDRKVRMAVVVQRMVPAQASGVLFTADPMTGNRKVSFIEATFGLGEALVTGMVNADVYKVSDGAVVGGQLRLDGRSLTDAQAVRLAELGRRIEAHFGRPQDIEWCLVDDDFHIVQSRPITTLFPIPAATDGERHVYLSVGHQQMMTDALKPLGISVRELTAAAQFHEAGGRQFVDVSRLLASSAGRAALMGMAGKSDPLTGDALRTVIERNFISLLPDQAAGGPPPGAAPPAIATDPAIVAELIERGETSIAALKRDIRGKSGPALLDFMLTDFEEMKRVLTDPLSHQAIMAGTEATWWLNDRLYEWLGEKGAADILSQSAPNNVTSEMGLALLDVADVIRPHREVVAYLQQVSNEKFLNELPGFPGGRESRDAITAFLDRYGMRCVGEIDITRPRWVEQPSTLLPAILGNVRHSHAGAGREHFERGLRDASKKAEEVLARLRALPNGDQKAEETKRMIDRLRTFIGYREYPKYSMVTRYFVYKQALMAEADRLVQAAVMDDREEIFFLTFHELRDVVRTRHVDDQLIRERKDAFRSYQAITPPRVLTSEGEAIAGSYRREDIPAGALVGLAVSAGTVEGRARVIGDMADADLEPGDILVTAFTDPSWTPLFVAIKGLVTEVGGLMTHGAVIAREYGLPAVVGVENATRIIADGQRIRVHGTEGYVEILGSG